MPGNVIIKQNIIDKETGQIIKQFELGRKYFDEQKGYLFTSNKKKCSYFSNSADLLDKYKLTYAEFGKLCRLSSQLDGRNNLLVFRSGNILKPMQKEQIAKFLDLAARSNARFLNKMLKQGIIKRIMMQKPRKQSEEYYYLNPVYFFRGNWLSYSLYELFKEELAEILPKWVLDKFAS